MGLAQKRKLCIQPLRPEDAGKFFETQALTAVVGHQQTSKTIKADCSAHPELTSFGTKEATLVCRVLGESVANCAERTESLQVPGHPSVAQVVPPPATWL